MRPSSFAFDDGNASGQVGFALAQFFARRMQLAQELTHRRGELAGQFQVDHRTTLARFGTTKINPEMSGRSSNARAHRGGPHRSMIVARRVTRHVAERPAGRTPECLAQVM